jgi:hypothetical protein
VEGSGLASAKRPDPKTHKEGKMKKGLVLIFVLSLAMLLSCGETKTTTMVSSDGQICLDVLPPGAELFIDGKDQGICDPFKEPTCLSLAKGKHELEIRKAGFEDHSESIFVGEGAKQVIRVRMVALSGKPTGADQGK